LPVRGLSSLFRRYSICFISFYLKNPLLREPLRGADRSRKSQKYLAWASDLYDDTSRKVRRFVFDEGEDYHYTQESRGRSPRQDRAECLSADGLYRSRGRACGQVSGGRAHRRR